MIGCFADDSTDQPARLQTAGAVISWPVNFFEAERLWEQQLERAGIDYFRASECEMLVGQFAPERLKMSLNSSRAHADATRRDMVRVIEQVPLVAVAVSLVLKDFREIISSDTKARYYYGSDSTILVYGRLIKSIVELVHEDRPEWTKHAMAFTFDEHSNYSKAEEAYHQLQQKDRYCAALMGYIGHADDKRHSPLQMADLIAHEARLKTAQTLVKSDRERPAFTQIEAAHAIYYIGVMDRRDMLARLSDYPDPPADGSSNEYKWTLE